MRIPGLLVFLASAVLACAAPVERDLGEELLYFRAHAVPGDLPTAEATRKQACVLDLRYAQASGGAADILGSWLKFHASRRTPIFVLVNGTTAASLLNVLADADDSTALLTIGIAGQKFHPDITVHESAENERRAYEALEAGTGVSALTTDNPTKQRNDEASLSHDRPPEPTTDDTDGDTHPTAASKPKSPPHDTALQRAIQLHRGLKAMKRI